MKRPNLFHYATSELSQDAFICWLLSWASPKFASNKSELTVIAHNLLKAFLSKHNKELPTTIESFEIKKQHKNIDILVIINEKIVIPIEDKLHTKEHSNQLANYLRALENESYTKEQTFPIYLQTGEQGNYENVINAGFLPFLRAELIQVLKSCAEIRNDILIDYREYLEKIESDVQSFRSLKLADWHWHSWQGFYSNLQQRLDVINWDYVANKGGGFLGLWWHWNEEDGCDQYLQLEQSKLCFKIAIKKPEQQADLKWKWHSRIIDAGKDSDIQVIKPSRLAKGKWMTVAILNGDFRQRDANGKLDMEKTISVLKEAEAILDRAIQSK